MVNIDGELGFTVVNLKSGENHAQDDVRTLRTTNSSTYRDAVIVL